MGTDPSNGRETPSNRWHHDVENDALRVVGKPLRKVDARSKVAGLTQFADDLELPRMLHMKLLRSTVAHAKIVKIDTSAAEAMPGVHAVLTGEEMPTTFGILPVSQDEHALCLGKVRMIGDPVAAVAAVDEATAWDACRLIEVEYEKLDTITSIFDAADNPEPRIHDYGVVGNVHRAENLEFGDLADGFARAKHTREDVFFFEGNTHLPMEQHAALAHYDHDEKLTLWSSTQTPHYVHRALARVLAPLAACRIRVIAMPNGGGFGGKSDPFNHEICVAKLAMKTGRPVKVCLTREEVFYCHRGRHPVLMKSKIGVSDTGKILALDFESYLDGGSYGSYGVASTFYTGALQTVTYEVENYHFRGARFFTNKAPCGPKRGHGTPQPRCALEVQLDKIACDLGLDPAEIRLQNLAPAYSADRELSAHRLDGIGRLYREGRRRLPLEGAPRQAAARQGTRHRLQQLPHRCGPAHLLEQHAALGRAAAARPQWARHRLLWQHRHRTGLGLDPRLHRCGGAGSRSVRPAHRHGRHRSDAGRSR